MLSLYQVELDDVIAKIQNEAHAAVRLKAEGSLVGVLRAYNEMFRLLEDFYLNKFMYNVFATRPFQSNPAMTPVEISRGVDEVLRSMRFSVNGDGQAARRGERLANPIVFRVFLGNATNHRNGDGDIAATNSNLEGRNGIGVSGLPVRVIYGNHDTITVGALNHDGEITVSAEARQMQGNRGNIFLRICNASFPHIDSGLFQFNVAEAYYTLRMDADTTVHLTVTDENGNRNVAAEARIGQILSGTRIQQGGANAPVFMRGVATVDTSSSGEMFHATVSVHIQVGITQTNEVVQSFSATGSARSRQSEAHARTLAMQNIEIANRDIAFAMRAAESRLNR
jgi:hypothetical protein